MSRILKGFAVLILLSVALPGCKKLQRSKAPRTFKIAFQALSLDAGAPAGVKATLAALKLSPLTAPLTIARPLTVGQSHRFRVRLIHQVKMARNGVSELRATVYQALQMRSTLEKGKDGLVTERLSFPKVRLGIQPGHSDVTRKLEDVFKDAQLLARRTPAGLLQRIDFERGMGDELKNFLATFRQVLLQTDMALPGRPIKQDETWTARQTFPITLPDGGKLTLSVDTKSQLKGATACPTKSSHRCAVVLVNASLTIGGELKQLGVRAKVSGKGHSQGVMLYDTIEKSVVLTEFGSRVTNLVEATVGKNTHKLKQTIQLALKKSELLN